MRSESTQSSTLNFPSQVTPEFSVALERGAEKWALRCSGVLDIEKAAAVLQPQLLNLHSVLLTEKVSLVEVSIEGLEYINSSGLKSFMAWFLAAANSRDGRYQIQVIFDPERTWQHTSFRPMERLAPNTVTLVPMGNATSTAW